MSQEVHTEGESSNMVKTIWRTFWIMLIVTIIEITAALTYPYSANRLPLNIFFVIMSGVKAFYIVAVFMHLKFEIKYLIITVLLPTIFLMYTLIILLAEGNSWLNMQLAK
jgi:cytochrome c oxidase subunit 4